MDTIHSVLDSLREGFPRPLARLLWHLLRTGFTTTVVLLAVTANLAAIWTVATASQKPTTNNPIEVLVEIPQQLFALPEGMGKLIRILNEIDPDLVNAALAKFVGEEEAESGAAR